MTRQCQNYYPVTCIADAWHLGDLMADNGAPLLTPHVSGCRQGSTEMVRCPPLTSCPPGTITPLENYAGVATDLILFALLGIMWRAIRLHASFMRFFVKRERLSLAWKHFGLKVRRAGWPMAARAAMLIRSHAGFVGEHQPWGTRGWGTPVLLAVRVPSSTQATPEIPVSRLRLQLPCALGRCL
jgi:hypothetical protein